MGAGTTAGPPSKKDKLLTAEIIEEPEGTEEDTRGQDFEEEFEDFEDDALEFLNEDDILDVDKLRNVFQSVLDDEVGGGYKSRGGENDETADLLFFDDDLLEDEPEPIVSFVMDDKETGKK